MKRQKAQTHKLLMTPPSTPNTIHRVMNPRYVHFLPNLSDKIPERRTPMKFPTKKMVCMYRGICLRSQTRSYRSIAVFWKSYTGLRNNCKQLTMLFTSPGKMSHHTPMSCILLFWQYFQVFVHPQMCNPDQRYCICQMIHLVTQELRCSSKHQC